MDLVRLAVMRPVGVAVGVILVVLFGIIGFGAVPVQLSPNVDRPIITVQTFWQGRSPEEIVDEIVTNQEEELKNVTNLKKMTSSTTEGESTVTMEFTLGADITRALQEVSDALRQVGSYPEDVEEPTIKASDGASENAIAWIITDVEPIKADNHPDFDISTLYNVLDKEVKPIIERIDGVAEVNIYGGRDREMQVRADPVRMAQRSITYGELLSALRDENRDVSAGTIAEGKRDYRVRVIGQFEREADLLDVIVAYRDAGPVYLSEIADVSLDYEKRRSFVRSLGNEAIAMNVIRQSGANVMEVMAGVRAELDAVRAEVLPNVAGVVGPDLRMRQVYDETIYIDSAIELVQNNLVVGGAIAIIVLLLFLRSLVSTAVVALAIPVSVVGTFLVLLVLGRTINVISLAGLAFAVGMVVDNAIVVLENIDRHRAMGKTAMRAAYDGGKEVVGAIVAATLTTVAVFIPVLTIQEEAGQLFRDIALAVVASVSLSLIVSITVIPAASSRWMRTKDRDHKGMFTMLFGTMFGIVPLCRSVNRGGAALLYWLMTGWRGWTLRPGVIAGLVLASYFGVKHWMPPMDYLPAGNRNLVFGFLLTPPGYSMDQYETVAGRIETVLEPYLGDDLESMDPIPSLAGGDPFDPVAVDNFFIAAFNGAMIAGATSTEPEVVAPIGDLLTGAMVATPDAFGGARQTSLFGNGLSGGSSIDVEILGPDLDRVKKAAMQLFGRLGQAYGYGSVRPDPANFSVSQQEFRATVTREGRELGVRTADAGTAVRSLFDGAFAGEFITGGDTIDIRVLPYADVAVTKEDVIDVPIATPVGRVVPLDTLVRFEPGTAPQAIKRIEELPAVTVSVNPPAGEPIESVMAAIEENYVKPLKESGLIDRTMRVRLDGTAAQLDEVKAALLGTGPDVSSEDGAVNSLQAVSWTGRGIIGVGILASAVIMLIGITKRRASVLYGALGCVVVGLVLGAILIGVGEQPGLLTARFVWALLVTYLLMCALFESFIYPFVIMFTVPLALVGGFAGLAIVHEYTAQNPLVATQNLDVLTMLGFVILVGVVVNNAILIVHQSLNLMSGEADLDPRDSRFKPGERLDPIRAVSEAVATRTRPVLMSTLTSVGGMLPLVLFPGAGSELYRGLGSVVIGGLLVSTIFTLLLVPMVFSLTLQMVHGVKQAMTSRGIEIQDAVGGARSTLMRFSGRHHQ